MAQDIDRKLRLTAALLGTVGRKDLAAAFRRVNANTPFDVGRADKWLHGRAQPRERQVYDDWAKVLGIDRPGQWIADCDIETFLDEICRHHARDREDLVRSLTTSGSRTNGQAPTSELTGTFASYSHAWSPYFRGRLICGELSVQVEPGSSRLAATYLQNLPTGVVQLHGSVTQNQRTLVVDLYHAETNERYSMSIFRPMPPVSVMVGYFIGVTTFLSPDMELTASRIVFIRLPPASVRRSTAAHLAEDASMAADLATLGLPVQNPAEVDRRLGAFLMTGHDRGIDRIAADQYAALTELFDRNWLSEFAAAEA